MYPPDCLCAVLFKTAWILFSAISLECLLLGCPWSITPLEVASLAELLKEPSMAISQIHRDIYFPLHPSDGATHMLLQYRLGCSEAFTCFSYVRDMGLISGLGRCPRVGNGNPVQYFCLKIPQTEETGRQQSLESDHKQLDMTEHVHT